jgi:hypothetical protein
MEALALKLAEPPCVAPLKKKEEAFMPSRRPGAPLPFCALFMNSICSPAGVASGRHQSEMLMLLFNGSNHVPLKRM